MGVPWVPTLYMIMTSVFPTHKFDIASQAETSLGLAQTLISVYRAWMCVFLGLLLVILSTFLGHYRAIVINIRKPPSLRIAPAGQLHLGDIGSQ